MVKQIQLNLRNLGVAVLSQRSAEEYPHLTELTRDHLLQPGYDFAHEYAFGPDLILDGQERLLS
jgi:hypothetical protein